MVKKGLGLFVYVLLLLLVHSPASATTYYVAKNGSDSNPGTEDNPWRTIQKAANTLQSGDTVLIRQGVYQEKVRPGRSGTEGNYITYRSLDSEEVVIDAQNGVRDACIRVEGMKYLQFVGLRLTGASGTSGLRAGFHASDESGHLVLDNITACNNRFGILIHGKYTPVSHVTIRNCTITGNTGHGIFLYRRVYDTGVGPKNHVFSNAGEEYTFGIEIGTDYPGNQVDGARDVVVFDNEIDHNGVQGIRTWNAMRVLIKNNYLHHNGATGIQLENGSEDMVVEDNCCEYNAQTYEYETGIWVDGTKNAVVRRNFLRGNKIGLMVTESSRVIVRHNVIVENNRGVPNLYNAMGLNVNRSTFDVAVVHNTMYRNGAAESTKGGISLCSKPPIGGVVIKNNILSETTAAHDLWTGCSDYVSDYNTVFNIRDAVVEWCGTDMSWSKYLLTSGQDSHSITANPLFVAPEAANFHLKDNSPCRDSGDSMTRTSNSGSGRVIGVGEARYFTDGFEVIAGDLIKVGVNNPVRITEVDYGANTLTVDQNISWSKGDGVSYPYSGSAPDMGAYSSDNNPPDPPTGLKRIEGI
jgi:parallel beta-helix repeat protein